jgi:hypothetical protein
MGLVRLVAWAAIAANLGAPKVVATSDDPYDTCSIYLRDESQRYSYSPFVFDEGCVGLVLNTNANVTSFKMLALGETGWEADGEAGCDNVNVCLFDPTPRLAVLRGSVFAVEDARKRTNVFAKDGSSNKWTALPVLNEPLVGLEANGAGELRLQTAYRGDGCAGVCLREYAVSTRLQLVGETLLPAQADPLNIAVGADAIAYVNRTDAVLEGYQVVVRSRAVAEPVVETVLPPVDLSGQFDVLQLVLSGDQIMLRTGAAPNRAPDGSLLQGPRYYWSSIRVFRRSAATAPSYELLQSFYDTRDMSGASPYSSAAVMRVSGKRMAVMVFDQYHDGRLWDRTTPSTTWVLFEFNGTAWAPSAALEDSRRAGYVASIGFAGDRIVFQQPASTGYLSGPHLMTLPADCKALSTVETVALVASSLFALCVLCVVIFSALQSKRAAAAKRKVTENTLAVSPSDL